MCQRRGAEGPVEVLALLSKTSPRATVGAGRRILRLALDEEASVATFMVRAPTGGGKGIPSPKLAADPPPPQRPLSRAPEWVMEGTASPSVRAPRAAPVVRARPPPGPRSPVEETTTGSGMAPIRALGMDVVVETPQVPAQRRRRPLLRPHAPLLRPRTGSEQSVRQESRPGATPPPAWPVHAKHRMSQHRGDQGRHA
ncbi:atherin-like [Hordeum vulgare subsp. vulgare]|uniref:atherin-like n=1 Tax=Hordeum vulgare subsp. vulgare TaxID=112509 RepID=UPI001D1A515D|nr:atherin-like [Hordeum vulgare subsp. vulgare]